MAVKVVLYKLMTGRSFALGLNSCNARNTRRRAAAIYRVYRDMRYFFVISPYTGCTEIDGRLDGEKRKYTKSHSADATSVGPHEFRCCAAYMYKLSAPIEIKISRLCKYLNV